MKILSDAIRIITALVAIYVITVKTPVVGVFILITVFLSLFLKLRSRILINSSKAANWWEFIAVLVLCLNALVLGFGKYDDPNFMFLDIPLHFLGGAVAGWWAWLAFYYGKLEKFKMIEFAIVFLGVVALVGLAWEFFEWGLDQTLGVWYALPPSQPSVDDTLADLLMDILGGVLVLLIGLKINRESSTFKNMPR